MPLVEKVPKPAEFPQVPFIDRVVDLRVVLRNKSYGSKAHRTFEAPKAGLWSRTPSSASAQRC